MTMEEYTKRLVELYNSTEGNLNELDGYDCKECQNRGNFAKALVDDYGDWFDSRVNCSCVKIRKSIHRLKKSGLENVMKLYTFDNYRSSEDWQDKIKKALSMDYRSMGRQILSEFINFVNETTESMYEEYAFNKKNKL